MVQQITVEKMPFKPHPYSDRIGIVDVPLLPATSVYVLVAGSPRWLPSSHHSGLSISFLDQRVRNGGMNVTMALGLVYVMAARGLFDD